MVDQRRSLLLEIARCSNVKGCLTASDETHPCSRVVLQQWPEPGSFTRRQRLWKKRHQLPEPWVGHLEDVRILFISSNPSLWPPKGGYTDEHRPVGNINEDWADEKIEHRYSSAFEDFMDEKGVRLRQPNGDGPGLVARTEEWWHRRSHHSAHTKKQVATGATAASPAEEIERLSALRTAGAITDEEFQRGKDRALS